ncbi:MAG: hypothetical protein HYX84_05250 [Chloroflexi bacterium]|nr:hypothetical protein [Chloroflexota bacterium]
MFFEIRKRYLLLHVQLLEVFLHALELGQPHFGRFELPIPFSQPKTVRVLAAEIDRAVRQIAAVARETGAVRLEWSGEGLNLSGGPEDARVTTRLPVQTDGNPAGQDCRPLQIPEGIPGRQGRTRHPVGEGRQPPGPAARQVGHGGCHADVRK